MLSAQPETLNLAKFISLLCRTLFNVDVESSFLTFTLLLLITVSKRVCVLGKGRKMIYERKIVPPGERIFSDGDSKFKVIINQNLNCKAKLNDQAFMESYPSEVCFHRDSRQSTVSNIHIFHIIHQDCVIAVNLLRNRISE